MKLKIKFATVVHNKDHSAMAERAKKSFSCVTSHLRAIHKLSIMLRLNLHAFVMLYLNFLVKFLCRTACYAYVFMQFHNIYMMFIIGEWHDLTYLHTYMLISDLSFSYDSKDAYVYVLVKSVICHVHHVSVIIYIGIKYVLIPHYLQHLHGQ